MPPQGTRSRVSRAPMSVSRRVGRPSRGRGTYMKKVSKKGAYKKNIKNQMSLRRAPIVETKQRVHSDIAVINGYDSGGGNLVNPLNWRTLVTDDAFTLLPLHSYYRNTHGFNEYNTIGHNIFSKYLNFKMELRFPKGEEITFKDAETGEEYVTKNKIIEDSTKVYLICGWITQSLNYPVNDNPSPSLPKQSDAGMDAIETYITQQLKPYFDDDEDKLQFRPKQTTNIKIDKYKRLAPKLDKQISSHIKPLQTWEVQGGGNPAWLIQPSGSVPEVRASHSYKCMKKLALTEGKELSFPTDKQNLYPNNSWLPFAVIYNPDYEKQVANTTVDPTTGRFSQVQFMEYRWNDAHYFSDS